MSVLASSAYTNAIVRREMRILDLRQLALPSASSRSKLEDDQASSSSIVMRDVILCVIKNIHLYMKRKRQNKETCNVKNCLDKSHSDKLTQVRSHSTDSSSHASLLWRVTVLSTFRLKRPATNATTRVLQLIAGSGHC